jgi:hypothetical protein
MLTHNRFAFKEWAAVCAALAAGRQSLILRKGGIHEGRDGFRADHGEFWLFPTGFHQQPAALTDDGTAFHRRALEQQPSPGTIAVQHYAVVHQVYHLTDEQLLPRLVGLHIWSERTVHDRFHYRSPELFALAVRVWSLASAVRLPESPHFAGCRSWVDLPVELPTDGLYPVLSDERHTAEMERVARALVKTAVA